MSESNQSEEGTKRSPPRPTPVVGQGATGEWSGGPALPFQMPDRIGQFEVRLLLGEGQCGRVYLGYDTDLGREVAIKVPRPEGFTPEFHERFLREARATATIHHENVCAVYLVGTIDELPYLVMQYAPNGTLAGLLDSDRPLQLRQKLIIARKLALGLAAAHAQKVVHRDLKPANVLYDKVRGQVFITDFGLARIGTHARGTIEGTVFGTPNYMSPEQARGHVSLVGPHSDIYSLGVILYEMLTGRVPFKGSVYEVLQHHCETPPLKPSIVRPSLDTKLDALCLKAMSKTPTDRYRSAKEFADAIATYLRGEDPAVGAPPRGAAPAPEALDLPEAEEEVEEPDHAAHFASMRQRRRRGLKIVAVLFLLCAALVVPIALDRKEQREAAPGERQPVAPDFSGHKVDFAAERRAAEWVLELKTRKDARYVTLEISTPDNDKTRSVSNPADLRESEFFVRTITIDGVPRDLDAQLRTALTGLSGPLVLRLEHVSFLSDEALITAARVPKLRDVQLVDTPRVTDAGLAALSKHPELRYLQLANLNVTSAGLASTVRAVPKLFWLRVDRSLVSDELLIGLKGAPELTRIDLDWQSVNRTSRLTRAGVEALAGQKNLTELVLANHPVEDQWLPALYPLKKSKLKEIDLRDTYVTQAGRDELKKVMGDTCKVLPEPPKKVMGDTCKVLPEPPKKPDPVPDP